MYSRRSKSSSSLICAPRPMNTCMWAGSVGLTVSPSEELSTGTSRQPSGVSCSSLIWSAMMLEIAEDVERVADDLVRLLALDIGDEADAAGILLECGIVKTFGRRTPVVL